MVVNGTIRITIVYIGVLVVITDMGVGLALMVCQTIKPPTFIFKPEVC